MLKNTAQVRQQLKDKAAGLVRGAYRLGDLPMGDQKAMQEYVSWLVKGRQFAYGDLDMMASNVHYNLFQKILNICLDQNKRSTEALLESSHLRADQHNVLLKCTFTWKETPCTLQPHPIASNCLGCHCSMSTALSFQRYNLAD